MSSGAVVPPVHEFILWSNCTNRCRFCLQSLKADPRCILSDEEKMKAIQEVRRVLPGLPYGDVLLIGGEVFGGISRQVAEALLSLVEYCRERVESGRLRYLYMNTNLLYRDLSTVYGVCSLFSGFEDHLRLATSYDVYGRFRSHEDEELFFKNVSDLTSRFPDQSVTVNTILTRQYCTSGIGVRSIIERTGARAVVLVPYIPVRYGDEMTPTPQEIFRSLEEAESEYPGYIHKYIESFDLKQSRTLWEYHSTTGSLVECDSPLARCGHSSNFARVLGDRCYVCELKSRYSYR